MNKEERQKRIDNFKAVINHEYRDADELWAVVQKFDGGCMICDKRRRIWAIGLEINSEMHLVEPKSEMYFKEQRDGRIIYDDLDATRTRLATMLERYIDPKRVIEEVIKALDYDQLKEIEERVEKKKEDIKPKKGWK